ncbi:MAG TPA: PIG-L family deacetylase [Thermoanaerobaculia bacterium]|jgi:LmbE family N-acetylglucosaminyl deacetylase|nr:PIG-L family deacetylase [Thermoanaerobaculia bacterium]
MRRTLLLVLTLSIAAPAVAKDAAQLQLALRRLTHVGGALYVAAHPDDENTALLSYLVSDRQLRTAYLSVTRGDGGQNLIGNEAGPLLGVIRTHELLQARRIDGAEQLFTRAVDFGYSKNPEETLKIWGHDEVLADVVWAIRRFQPDVIITRFPTNGDGGHGHHTASAMLAEEAFAAAADATKFPDQLRLVSVWQPKRIFWNRFSFGRPLDPNDPALAKSLRIDLGTYNPLLGRAYTEIAAESRSLHKSQGFGSAERRGSILNYFEPRAGDPATKDLFEGIDTRWSRYPGGEKVGAIFERAASTFDGNKPQATVPILIEALRALEQLRALPEWSEQRKPWIETKQHDILDAIRDCAGIAIDVAASDSTIVEGGKLPVSVTVVNRSDHPFRLSMVASLYANPSKAPGTPLENNKPVKTDLVLELPPRHAPTQPYWLERDPKKGLYTVTHQLMIGQPDNYAELPINVTLDDPQMNTLIFSVPAVFRWTDPVKGEQTREVDIVPAVSLKLGSNVYLFPEAKPRDVTVSMKSYGATTGQVKLVMPEGWKASPGVIEVKLAGKGDEQQATFTVTPPAGASVAAFRAEFASGDTNISKDVVDIDYPHIPAQRILVDSVGKVVRADIKHRGSRLGYIMGSGDDVPNILRQVGYEVTLLTDADLDRGDFQQYDAIVAGIRAYNTRDRLKLAHEKLMRYVENGGTMVVQYNTSNQLGEVTVAVPGPYPFKISRDRVTVEEAPVKLGEHAVLNTPNKITAADFDGWVQERGLYFTTESDPRYATMLSSGDPGEPEKPGGQLVAKHGKGTFVYTSYAWWRQLPAGVPGAIRAFVNLVSAK